MNKHLKLGFFIEDLPRNCKLNLTSYFATLNSCYSTLRKLVGFVYIQYLFPADAEMILLHGLGNLSDTRQISSNVSFYQALEFGTIDGFVGGDYYISPERLDHFAFANSFKEERTCFVMSAAAVEHHAESANNLYWFEPFSAFVWIIFLVSLLLYALLNHGKNGNGFTRDSVFGVIMTTFVVIYSSKLRANFIKESYVEFPYKSLETLVEPVRTRKVHLATTRYQLVQKWLLDTELKMSLLRNPLISLDPNGDICDYRNHFNFAHQNTTNPKIFQNLMKLGS